MSTIFLNQLQKAHETGSFALFIKKSAASGELFKVIPALKGLNLVPQNPRWHPEGDVWTHTLLVIENLPSNATFAMALSALFHDVGKATATVIHETGRITAHGHEKDSKKITSEILVDLGADSKLKEDVLFLVFRHMIAHSKDTNVKTLDRLILEAGTELVDQLLLHGVADVKGGCGDLTDCIRLRELFESMDKQRYTKLDPKFVKDEKNDFKAVIFDCDGTLIDSEGSHFYAWQKVVLNRDHHFSLEDFIQCMGNASPAIAQKLAIKMNSPSAEELLSESRDYYQRHAKTGQKPIQHTVEFALKLAKEKERLGIKLAVASAGKKDEILRSLKQIGIDEIFDAIISGQDDLHTYSDPKGVNKPNPYIYWHTAKVLGVKPSDCVVIEDSLPGLTAGLRAGCFTVAIPTESTIIQNLSCADLELKSFENLSIEQFFHLVEEKSQQKAATHTPTVIFLNGTSSAGKTSLVQHLQEGLDQPFIHIGIDHFLFMFPNRYRMDGAESHLGYRFERDEVDGIAKISITKGPYGNKMNAVMHNTVQNLLTENFNLIIDEVLFSDDDYHAYLNLLQNYRVYFIAVKPPLEIAEQREKIRGGRMLGLARGLYDNVYQNKVFDIEIDTSRLTSEEAAQTIIQYVHNNPHPQALKENIAQYRVLYCS